jgi:DNA-binding NtrC family response regulator
VSRPDRHGICKPPEEMQSMTAPDTGAGPLADLPLDPAAAGLSGRVLMVDDDPSICSAIGSLLDPWPVEFACCHGLEEGRRQALAGDWDALILDLEFPGANEGGLSLLAELRAEGFDRPVLIFTSEVNVHNFQQAIRFGIFNFLAKPIRRGPFLIALRGALENRRLRQQRRLPAGEDPIVGVSAAMLELKARLRNIAPWAAPVLITGESGTGKELVCSELRRLGPRADKPYRVLNCASLRAETIRDELFGHERGAYTGAEQKRPGLAEEAHGGMLFLDEIGLLPLSSQGVLLRFLQEGEIHALGSNQVRRVDVQVIAATNEDLPARVAAGEFRQDLFERIAALRLHCPPLRERGRDVRLLAELFLFDELAKRGLPFRPIPEDLLRLFETRRWPGNVRQLRHAVLNLIAHFYHAQGAMGSAAALLSVLPELAGEGAAPEAAAPGETAPAEGAGPFTPEMILPYNEAKRLFTRAYFRKAVDALEGNITAAARALDVNPSTVHRAFAEELEDEERKWGWVRG